MGHPVSTLFSSANISRVRQTLDRLNSISLVTKRGTVRNRKRWIRKTKLEKHLPVLDAVTKQPFLLQVKKKTVYTAILIYSMFNELF